MKTELARKLDSWLGMPLCLFFSGLNLIFKPISIINRKPKSRPVKKILFLKLTELGAIILAYPLLACLKEEYPDAEFLFLTLKRNQDVFKLLGGIIPRENILAIRHDSACAFLSDTLAALKRIRRENIDIVFDLEFFSRFTAALSYLTGSDIKVGFYHYTFEGLYRGGFLTHKAQYNPLKHISNNYLSLAQLTGAERKDSPELERKLEVVEFILPKHTLREDAKQELKNKLTGFGVKFEANNRLFLLNPGEGILPMREWPLDNFISLSKMLLRQGDNFIIIIGTDEATNKAKLILKNINSPRCINLTGQTDLEELMALFNVADALVSNDSGLAHLATLTPIKKFVIFGPESPEIFGPMGTNNWVIYSDWPCSPCLSAYNHRNSACKDNFCLKAINPDYVYGLIKAVLLR